MEAVTLRIIDGSDRGKLFGELSFPVTIGREDGNSVELNDERVSRFHLKIFRESGNTVLADLGSTNGTQINGETVHLWILRPGDLIQIGKTLLLYGTKSEIARRLKSIRAHSNRKDGSVMGLTPEESDPLDVLEFRRRTESAASVENTSNMILEQEIFADLRSSDLELLRSLFSPKLPENLSSPQKAELTELFVYLQLRLRAIVGGIESLESQDDNVKGLFDGEKSDSPAAKKSKRDKESGTVPDGHILLSERKWQNLLDLYALVAAWLEKLP